MKNLTRGERFQDARQVHNQHGKQTMKEVELATGVNESMIANLENDEKFRSVGYDKITKLAIHYGVSADYLLGLSPYPRPIVLDDLCIRMLRNMDASLQEIKRYYAGSTQSEVKTNGND